MLPDTLRLTGSVRFIVLFLVLFTLLSGTNYILTGLIAPGGYYIALLHDHMDYVTATRDFLLNCTGKVVHVLGYRTRKQGYVLSLDNGHSIRMVYSCIGLHILCVWWAFILAYPFGTIRKIIIFLSGTLFFICLNITRLTLLILRSAPIIINGKKIDHHDIYNILIYIIMILGMKLLVDRVESRAA